MKIGDSGAQIDELKFKKNIQLDREIKKNNEKTCKRVTLQQRLLTQKIVFKNSITLQNLFNLYQIKEENFYNFFTVKTLQTLLNINEEREKERVSIAHSKINDNGFFKQR